eukprot:tig00000718_g3705.t1
MWSAAARAATSLDARSSFDKAQRARRALSVSAQAGSSSENLNEALKDVTVFRASDGAEVPIVTLWAEKPTCIAFFRSALFTMCNRLLDAGIGVAYFASKFAEALSGVAEGLRACGVELVGVGSGTVEQAAAWAQEVPFAGAVYTDPSKSSYAALGLARGLLTTFNPASLVKTVQAFQAGYTQNWAISSEVDGFQQGGLFVVDTDGSLLFAHREARAGDHPDPRALLAACPRPPPASLPVDH